jgi:ComF family protein
MTNSFINKYFESLVSLFYPKLCLVCGSTLFGNEELICTYCRHSLPETGFHKSPGNPVEQLFWGRLSVEHATALLYFDKGSSYRRLVHQLKYQGRKDSGLYLGRLLGSALKESIFSTLDCIVPIPLHPAKLRRRGFNQSQVLAEGIAEILHIDVYNDILRRVIYTQTQTRRKRYDRWENVEGIFACRYPDKITNKHILLVDDVITTGATIEAAGSELSAIEGVRLSIAAAAYTHV